MAAERVPASGARTRGTLGPRLRAGLFIAAAGVTPLPLQGQSSSEPREGPSLALRGLRSAQCVRFLIPPSEAARHVPAGSRPIRADQDSSLHPALRSLIEGQPEFAPWSPSSLCFFYLDTVRIAGRTMAAGKGRKPQMISVWTLAATQPGGARRDVALDVAAGSAQTVRAAEAVKLRMREASSRISHVPEGTDELHELRLGKTRLVWTGRAAGDSSRVDQRIEKLWLLKGALGTSWNARFVLQPSWSRPLAGVLSVEGKDDLAQRLKASPIRFVGPRHLGGSADIHLSR